MSTPLPSVSLVPAGLMQPSTKKGVEFDTKLKVFAVILLGITVAVLIALYVIRRRFRLNTMQYNQEIKEVEDAREMRFVDPDLKPYSSVQEARSSIARQSTMPVSEYYELNRRPSRTGSEISTHLQWSAPKAQSYKYVTYTAPQPPVAILSRQSNAPSAERPTSPRSLRSPSLPRSPRSSVRPIRKLSTQRSEVVREYVAAVSQNFETASRRPSIHSRSNSLPSTLLLPSVPQELEATNPMLPSPQPVLFKEHWGFPPPRTSSADDIASKSLHNSSVQNLAPLPLRSSIPQPAFIVDPVASAEQLRLATHDVPPNKSTTTVESVLLMLETVAKPENGETSSVNPEQQALRVEQWLEGAPSVISDYPESELNGEMERRLTCRGIDSMSSVYSSPP